VPLSDEERLNMERKGLEEQKQREALAEKAPEWSLYCHMSERQEVAESSYWKNMIDE
jgi:hypothetical protein